MRCSNCGTEYEGEFCPGGCNMFYYVVERPDPLPSWLIIVLIGLFYPLGIVLMWVKTYWKLRTKLVISIAYCLLSVGLFILYKLFT